MVERALVPNPAQARALINAVAAQQPSGPRLEAFFCALYLTGMRPEEAVVLRWPNVQLPQRWWDPGSQSWQEPEPKDNWGEIVIREAAPEVGKQWTNSGKHRDRLQPRGRAAGESRVVPCAPQLTSILHRHYARFGEGPDRLVFFGVQGRQLDTGVYSRAWKRARAQVLDREQQASSLASTPYDLRRACVSTWLDEGVSPAQAAEWAGHSLEVLMSVYARCISGHEERNKDRMEAGFVSFSAE
ncbi:tyrosine-type recombinase/integrase [Nocardiopsis terrae]